MDELMTARSLTTRPVVTLGGDAVAQVKDTVFDAAAGRIVGFALSGRGLLSGSLGHRLPWSAVHCLGHDAVMIRSRRDPAGASPVPPDGEVLRDRVLGARLLTDSGTEVGTVLDVVVAGGRSGRVVGFRVDASKALVPGPRRRRRRVYVPRGEDLTVTGRALVLPGESVRVTEDLSGLGALAAGRPGCTP
ncbi:PRC-barrel domain-containing protein [Streptomyces fumanus]|nr:PRC-barrel domain-containing protein [Streptomyces fumanus]